MAASTKLDLSFTAAGQMVRALDLTDIIDRLNTDDTFSPLNYSFTSGTGSGQFDNWWHDTRTVSTTANDNLDLRGGTVSTKLNLILDFATIKGILIAIDSPSSSKTLRIGPQGVSNAFQGSWGGTGATVYDTVAHSGLFCFAPYTGYTVTAGTGDTLGIYNPSAGSVTYHILIWGVQA